MARDLCNAEIREKYMLQIEYTEGGKVLQKTKKQPQK